MKKIVIIVVLTGMFAWAVYDLTADSRGEQSIDENNFTVAENTADQEKSDKLNEDSGSDETGLEVGDMAPDFKLETLEGEEVSLSDYRGQRVVVNFWATWCRPCRAEMPDMQKFYEDKDVEILAVNLTSSESSQSGIQDFVDAYQLTFPVLMDKNSEVANQYQIKPIPSSFMIDSSGRIQFKALGAMNYELMVQEFEKMP
ncbi:redoxin domain-containing protein [Lentibacillus jeotgali]|uniref:redoxin domain-containing protein n=1 Tax=Lentibacillus jeotgali TaxID=558169 RepID=UPI0002625848|nr:redoxin domain-containing protein [Lentibacillus jeotgali]